MDESNQQMSREERIAEFEAFHGEHEWDGTKRLRNGPGGIFYRYTDKECAQNALQKLQYERWCFEQIEKIRNNL